MTRAINYSGLILKPTKVFWEWISSEEIARQLPEDKFELLKSINYEVMVANSTVVTTPMISRDKDSMVQRFVLKHARELIAAEFARWDLPMEAKPSTPDADLVHAWFEISYHTHIFTFDPAR